MCAFESAYEAGEILRELRAGVDGDGVLRELRAVDRLGEHGLIKLAVGDLLGEHGLIKLAVGARICENGVIKIAVGDRLGEHGLIKLAVGARSELEHVHVLIILGFSGLVNFDVEGISGLQLVNFDVFRFVLSDV